MAAVSSSLDVKGDRESSRGLLPAKVQNTRPTIGRLPHLGEESATHSRPTNQVSFKIQMQRLHQQGSRLELFGIQHSTLDLAEPLPRAPAMDTPRLAQP